MDGPGPRAIRKAGNWRCKGCARKQGSPAPMRFFSYKDPEEQTREQIKIVRSHPWISKDVPVRGVVFDMETGRLHEVKEVGHEHAAA